MKINLHEIPEDGKHFSFTRKTGELNAVLKDLVADQEFDVEFDLRPLKPDVFEIRGRVRAALPDLCSRCGEDFFFAVQEKVNELLMPTFEVDDRKGHYAKSNHYSELVAESEGPSIVEYESHFFDVGEYVHEMIALARPFNPAPPVVKDRCATCHRSPAAVLPVAATPPLVAVESPFAVLKNLKN